MNRKLISRIIAGLLAVLLILGCFASAVFAAEAEGVTVKLHYNRPDGDYTDWTVWFWVDQGADYPFVEEDGEMVATYEVPDGASQIGFIVRKPDWTKDVNMDQFIDVAAYIGGTVHVYVEAGVEGYELKESDDVKIGIKVKEAAYEIGKGIKISLTATPDAGETFKMEGPSGPVAIASVTDQGSNKYLIETVEELDLGSDYTLTFMGAEYQIRMPNISSTDSFEAEFTYEGDDLGATWTAEKTTSGCGHPLLHPLR